jgi:nucleoside-diphosphate-sugar epimerase
LDICRAIRCALDAPREVIHNQVFNIGDSRQNYRVREIAEVISSVFPGCALSFGTQGADNRSYRVSFDKVAQRLPGFKCEWDVEKGARQFYQLFQQIDMTPEVFNHRGFTRLKQLEYLIRTKQIDKDFFWTATNI